MQVPVHSTSGDVVSQIEISDYLFGAPVNEAVTHQALLRHLANRRQGNASTKTRGEVAGSTRKLFAQKHTGRARAGSIKSPLRRGGGIIFGPSPRDYHQALPKKMRRLALRSALSGKVRDEELVVVDKLEMEAPKTKEMVGILAALGIDSTALIATTEMNENMLLSARNIPGVTTTPANLLNVADILAHRKLVMTVSAVRRAEELWGAAAKGGDGA